VGSQGIELTFLGTGTSHGVPMIGCDCSVCRSSDPRNSRTRASVLVKTGGLSILIDTSPELRIQAIREGIQHVDALLFTHAHADHLFGLDDVRRFNDLSGEVMPCYGSLATLRTIKKAFEYVFVPTQIGGGKPQLDLIPITGPFFVGDVQIIPVPVLHGRVEVLGFRIGGLAYVTDCSSIPLDSRELLVGLDILVLGVLRPEPHETHFSLSQGLKVVEDLRPRKAYFTHIAHRMDHESVTASLPSGVELAYDGLVVRA